MSGVKGRGGEGRGWGGPDRGVEGSLERWPLSQGLGERPSPGARDQHGPSLGSPRAGSEALTWGWILRLAPGGSGPVRRLAVAGWQAGGGADNSQSLRGVPLQNPGMLGAPPPVGMPRAPLARGFIPNPRPAPPPTPPPPHTHAHTTHTPPQQGPGSSHLGVWGPAGRVWQGPPWPSSRCRGGRGRQACMPRAGPACLPQMRGSRQPGSLGHQATPALIAEAPPPQPHCLPPPPPGLSAGERTRPSTPPVSERSVPGEKPDSWQGVSSTSSLPPLLPLVPASKPVWPLADCGQWGSDSARLRAGLSPGACRRKDVASQGRLAQTQGVVGPAARGENRSRRLTVPGRQQRLKAAAAGLGGHSKQGTGCQNWKGRGRGAIPVCVRVCVCVCVCLCVAGWG